MERSDGPINVWSLKVEIGAEDVPDISWGRIKSF